MDIEEKLELAIEVLKEIATFGHVEDCLSHAPVDECCCYDKDKWKLAKEVLEKIE